MHWLKCWILMAAVILGSSAHAFTRLLTFQIAGQTYYGFLFNQQRMSASYGPDALNYEDYSFSALETLLFKETSFFNQPENLELWKKNSDVDVTRLQDTLEKNLAAPDMQMGEINEHVEKLVKQLIEQWIVEQYKKTRTYIDPSFFDELRKQEPIDKPGATTLALFDSQKRLVATLSLVIRTKERPLLDFESRVGISPNPFTPYKTRSYPLLRPDSLVTIPTSVFVAQDAELKKYVIDPTYDRTIIPAMLYFMDATGILAYGRSVHPELIGFNVRPAAIGRYFLEADTVGMRIYRNRRYGFETLGYHQESDTYVMSADREHLLNIAKNFIPPGSSFADLMAPFKPDFNYAASSYFKSGLQVDMPKRRAAIENLLSRVQALGCALHLEN